MCFPGFCFPLKKAFQPRSDLLLAIKQVTPAGLKKRKPFSGEEINPKNCLLEIYFLPENGPFHE